MRKDPNIYRYPSHAESAKNLFICKSKHYSICRKIGSRYVDVIDNKYLFIIPIILSVDVDSRGNSYDENLYYFGITDFEYVNTQPKGCLKDDPISGKYKFDFLVNHKVMAKGDFDISGANCLDTPWEKMNYYQRIYFFKNLLGYTPGYDDGFIAFNSFFVFRDENDNSFVINNGEITIPPKYDYINPVIVNYVGVVVEVVLNKKHGLLDIDGKTIYPLELDNIFICPNRKCVIIINDKYYEGYLFSDSKREDTTSDIGFKIYKTPLEIDDEGHILIEGEDYYDEENDCSYGVDYFDTECNEFHTYKIEEYDPYEDYSVEDSLMDGYDGQVDAMWGDDMLD